MGTGWASQLAMATEQGEWPPKMPLVRIHKVYVGRTGGIYLSRPTAEIKKFEQYLAKVERKLGDVKFVGGEVTPPADVKKVLSKLREADGVLLFHLSGHGGGAPAQAMSQIVDVGLPTAVFSQPFSGHGWMYFPDWQRAGKKVVLLPTSLAVAHSSGPRWLTQQRDGREEPQCAGSFDANRPERICLRLWCRKSCW